MNWKEYFALKDKKKRNLRKLLIVMVILCFFQIKGVVLEGENHICENINLTCIEVKEVFSDNITNSTINVTNSSLENKSIDNEIDDADLEDEKVEIKKDIEEDEKVEEKIIKFTDRIWIDCDEKCEAGVEEDNKIWLYRLIYTPLIFVLGIIMAHIFAWIIYFYSVHKIEGSKDEKEDEGDEKKEEKKE